MKPLSSFLYGATITIVVLALLLTNHVTLIREQDPRPTHKFNVGAVNGFCLLTLGGVGITCRYAVKHERDRQ